jgi:hypothetical protein
MIRLPVSQIANAWRSVVLTTRSGLRTAIVQYVECLPHDGRHAISKTHTCCPIRYIKAALPQTHA